MKTKVMLKAALVVMMAGSSLADWPQWRGSNRDGKSAETGLLKQWPKDGPPLAWRNDKLGGGYSAPSIAAGQMYGMSNRGPSQVVWALSEADGKELWAARLGRAVTEGMRQGSEGPGCTPTVDGKLLYVVGAGGTVACLQTADGKIVWQHSMTRDFGGRVPTWRYQESPLIDGDKVICTPGAEDALLVALDKRTGKTIWKTQMGSGSSGGASESGSGSGASGSSGAAGRSGGRGSATGARDSNSPAGVAGTKDPGLFMCEHWGMSAFSCKIPNGKYTAKLYFAEMYRGITGPGQRVFSFTVQGRQFKDFDIWAKAGGPRRAYVETVPVEVTNGEFRIVFTPKVENPAINAIEIIPQAKAATGAATIRIQAGSIAPFTDSKGQVWQAERGFEGGRMSNVGRRGFRPSGVGGRPGGFSRGRGGAGAGYASAIAIDVAGQRQYVQVTANSVVAVSASDGKFLWRYDRPANTHRINCTTPLFHDGHIFAASAYGAGGGLVKLTKDAGGGVQAEEVFFTRDMQNHHGGVILHDGCLYGANGGNEGGALVCLDFKTGKTLWDRRADEGRRAKGSLAFADGRLYYRMENGTVVLIEPNGKQYVEHGRFEQPDRTRSPAWTHPVIANGKLYIRDQSLLLCYDVKAK